MDTTIELGDFEALQHIAENDISKIISKISYDTSLKEVWINIFFSVGQFTSIILNNNDRKRFVQYLKEFIKISQESKSKKNKIKDYIIGHIDCDISAIGRVNINEMGSNKFVMNCDYGSFDNTYSEIMIVTSHLSSAYISVLIIDRSSASRIIAILDTDALN